MRTVAAGLRGVEPDTVRAVAEEYVLDVAGRTIAVTSPDKVFFSERGET